MFSRYLSPEGTYSNEPVTASVTSISPLTEGASNQTRTPEISATSSLSSTPVSSGNTGQTSVPVLDLSSRQASTPVRRWPQEPQARPVTAQALDITSSQAIASIQASRAAMTSGTPSQTSVPVTSSAINAPMDLRRKERMSVTRQHSRMNPWTYPSGEDPLPGIQGKTHYQGHPFTVIHQRHRLYHYHIQRIMESKKHRG